MEFNRNVMSNLGSLNNDSSNSGNLGGQNQSFQGSQGYLENDAGFLIRPFAAMNYESQAEIISRYNKLADKLKIPHYPSYFHIYNSCKPTIATRVRDIFGSSRSDKKQSNNRTTKHVEQNGFSNKSLETIITLGGFSNHHLFPNLYSRYLGLPTCIHAAVAYIYNNGLTTPRIFEIVRRSSSVSKQLFRHYERMMRHQQGRENVIYTSSSSTLPNTIPLDVLGVADFLSRILDSLDGGILGSEDCFVSIENIIKSISVDKLKFSINEFENRTPDHINLVSLALLAQMQPRLDLICAIFGLLSTICTTTLVVQVGQPPSADNDGLMTSQRLATRFGGLLLSRRMENLFSTKVETERYRRGEIPRHYLEQDPLQRCNRVARYLILSWRDIVLFLQAESPRQFGAPELTVRQQSYENRGRSVFSGNGGMQPGINAHPHEATSNRLEYVHNIGSAQATQPPMVSPMVSGVASPQLTRTISEPNVLNTSHQEPKNSISYRPQGQPSHPTVGIRQLQQNNQNMNSTSAAVSYETNDGRQELSIDNSRENATSFLYDTTIVVADLPTPKNQLFSRQTRISRENIRHNDNLKDQLRNLSDNLQISMKLESSIITYDDDPFSDAYAVSDEDITNGGILHHEVSRKGFSTTSDLEVSRPKPIPLRRRRTPVVPIPTTSTNHEEAFSTKHTIHNLERPSSVCHITKIPPPVPVRRQKSLPQTP